MVAQQQSLKGKCAVITGGARGIGRAVATELVDRGAKVAIGDILDSEGQATARDLNARAGSKVAIYVHADVSIYQDNIKLFRTAEQEFGGIDIALLNAGIVKGGDNLYTPLDDKADEKVMQVNTMGVIKGSKVALLHLARQGGGVIVITASAAGYYPEGPCAYNASKHGVIGWLKSFMMLPAVCNVRVNAVCPHGVATDLEYDLPAGMESVVEEMGQAFEFTPMQTVVRAVTTLIHDETANCKALWALPGDVVREQEPLAPLAELSCNQKLADLHKKVAPALIANSKKALQEALKNYELMELE